MEAEPQKNCSKLQDNMMYQSKKRKKSGDHLFSDEMVGSADGI